MNVWNVNKFPPLGSERSHSSLRSISRMKSVISSSSWGWWLWHVYVCTDQLWNVLPAFGNQLWTWIWWNLLSLEITCFKRWYLNMLLLRQGAPKLNIFRLILSEFPCQILLSQRELSPISQNMYFGRDLGNEGIQFSI